MHVDIDQPGRDVQAADVNHLRGSGRIDAVGDRCDTPFLDSDILRLIDLVLGVDQVTALEQQVILSQERACQQADKEQWPQQKIRHIASTPSWRSLMIAT